MKLLRSETIRPATPGGCAREVLETVPLLMRVIRAEMRRHRGPGLSVPQFRALAFLGRQGGPSLSEVAEHIGLTLPAMSQSIDGLVARGLVARRVSTADRRRITLTLTAAGRSVLAVARRSTQAGLAARLVDLAPAEREAVTRVMPALRRVIVPELAERAGAS